MPATAPMPDVWASEKSLYTVALKPNTGTIVGHPDAITPPKNPADESPDWHTMLVRAEGGKITVEIDLQTIVQERVRSIVGFGRDWSVEIQRKRLPSHERPTDIDFWGSVTRDR